MCPQAAPEGAKYRFLLPVSFGCLLLVHLCSLKGPPTAACLFGNARHLHESPARGNTTLATYSLATVTVRLFLGRGWLLVFRKHMAVLVPSRYCPRPGHHVPATMVRCLRNATTARNTISIIKKLTSQNTSVKVPPRSIANFSLRSPAMSTGAACECVPGRRR